ncbi:MAG: DUF4834 family protein [Eudoraea sp.]|nr:DUF4834 family protein [Muriicola sp.]NNE03999.1 DUF4834 family protein [Eudoraea sp.]
MGFLKTLLIILLVYYLLKVMARLFAPTIINYAAKRTERHFKEAFGQAANQPQDQKDEIGDVSVDKTSVKSKKSSNSVGEYIDFEEIE